MFVARTVLESVAKALSDTHEVKIVFYGNNCCTDGETIYLPSLPEKVPAKLVMMLRGYLDHEAGHIAFTDFDDYKKLPKNKTEQFALNAVEDIRIERKMESIWKGCKVNFERSAEENTGKLLKNWDDVDPVMKIFVLFIQIARYGEDVEIYTKHSIEYAPVMAELENEITRSKSLESTKEAYYLAIEVLEKIEHIVEDFKKHKDGGKGKGEGEGKGKGEGEEGKTTKKYKEGKDSRDRGGHRTIADDTVTPADDDKSDDDKSVSSIDEDAESLLKRLRKSLETDKERKLPDASEGIEKIAKGLSGYRVLSTMKDCFEPWHSSYHGLEIYEEFRKTIFGVTGVLRNKLNRLLMSKKRATWLGGKRHGIINPATLHQAVQGTSDKLYRHRKEGTRINTAVEILIDLSGSMGGRKVRKAVETVVLLSEALNMIKIPFEIIGFSGDRERVTKVRKEAAAFDRFGTLDMYYFKLFNEPLNQLIKGRIGNMDALAQNYDGESVRFAANRLLQRPEKKKVLFVLSDGSPCASMCRNSALTPHLKQVCKELEEIPDFYLCGFGILTEAPKKFYKNHVLVNDLALLPEVLMKNLFHAFI